MVRRVVIVATFALASFGIAAAQEREAFACVEHDTGGFKWENDKFAPTRFRQAQFTFVRQGGVIVLKKRGVEDRYECAPLWGRADLIRCTDETNVYVIDMKRLRFSRANLYAYVDNSDDSLVVAYGDCQRF